MDAAAAPQSQQEPYRRPDACILVVFGASGDLTKRLLLPALYNLATFRLLPERFGVFAVARKAQSETEVRNAMNDALRQFATTSIDPPVAAQLLIELVRRSQIRTERFFYDDAPPRPSVLLSKASPGTLFGPAL